MSEFYDLEIEKKQDRKAISRVGWALSALVIFSQIGAILVSMICKMFFKSFAKGSLYTFVVSVLPIYFIAFPIFFLIIRKIPKYNGNEKVELTVIQFIKILIISFGALYIFNIFGLAINNVIAQLKGSEVINPLSDLLSKVNMWETLFFAGILAPIMEEVIFRKVLLSRLRRFGDFFSILLSALAFGMFHGNLSQFFYAVALGCIFGYIVIKTGTIKYSIILHMSVNIFGAVIFPTVALSKSPVLLSLLGVFVFVVLILSGLLFLSNKNNIILENDSIYLTKREQLVLMFKNSGMILYTILFIILVVLVTMSTK